MKTKLLLISFLLSLFSMSCSKGELSDNNFKEINPSGRRVLDTSIKSDNSDISLLSPLRDILKYNPKYLSIISNAKKHERNTDQNKVIIGDEPDYHCCNDICLAFPENPEPNVFYYPFDAFGNRIHYIGYYGYDERNIYYVSLPNNVNNNSPIVLLIQGGGWFSGASGDILGFPYNWSTNSDNIVKDLLDNGYVVVSMLYRLVQYGENSTEFQSNPISWQDQIDDISMAVEHIRSSFPTCLWGVNLNATKIHLIGESAGGHLALMYAYTHPNLSYISSVISMYAPTNMNQYADKIDNFSNTFICGNNFDIPTHCPYYFPILNINNNNFIYNTLNPLTCTASNSSDMRVIPSINLIQSASKQVISNPATNTYLQNYSPCHKILQNSTTYPTFIMHGEGSSDNVVPYINSTNTMNTSLNSKGGLIGTYYHHPLLNFPPFTTEIPSSYTGLSSKNLIKLYYFANHGWISLFSTTRDKVRTDCIKWLNGH
jgi:pimeloyl-ACP methyl ester carboxylesterase